ncbi:MAG: calcium-translocating P-type ATPase, PMCA-type [Clostridia bacterium]|nr:calcium-translocating P-type ATPase, PMCA-type [Clostridia bacterium]
MKTAERVGAVKRERTYGGLTDEEVLASREKHGANTLSVTPPRSFLRHFLSNLGDPVIRILLCALGVNLVFVFQGGDWIETLGIAISVFLATLISTLSERGSEAAFRRLSEVCDRSEVRVRRNGTVIQIPMEEIVVGDVVLLSAGEQIPADGFMLSGSLRVDQSAMTGENREIEKSKGADRARTPGNRCAVFRGCAVLSGEGEMEVFAVGDGSFLGQISHEVQMETRESPLKLRLTKLAKQISRLGYCAAFLVAFAYLFNTFLIDSGFHWELIAMKARDIPYLLQHLLHAFMLGLTVVVVAVPEGLPMMIAVVLSSNIRRMIRDQVLVRKPVGIEAAGSMNLLFTDKTGTLTEGKMSVARILLADGSSYVSYQNMRKAGALVSERYACSCLCNTASSLSEGRAIGGNATDRALLESVADYKSRESWQVVDRIPFDSGRKFSAVSVRGRGATVLVKGAPERLIPYLEYAYDKEGRAVPFSPLSYDFLRQVSSMTGEGGRVLLLAEGERLSADGRFGALTLICAVMLQDRIRPEAKRSVRELRGAGIQVVMITGDNRDTAASIARECGILTGTTDRILTSEELSRLSDGELKQMLPRLAVVARALPSDKSRLVRLAQETERVVGMTGDGINDAPALKRADIGFAMGTGTHVAKDAGDIIILDNNLSSIAKAVLYGRNIFKSIRKFITLQLMMNFCAVGVSMIGPFVGVDAPVTVVQMLWINIIMDTLGGLAFAGEPPLPSCMKEKPKRRDEPILNGYMIHQIVLLGGFTIGLYLCFLLVPSMVAHFRPMPDRLCHLTAFFALFIFTSVFNCFNARTDRLRLFAGIGGNRAFVAIMILVCAVQILFVYLGGSVLRTMPLTGAELGYTLLLSLSVFPAELIRKLIWRFFGKKGGY